MRFSDYTLVDDQIPSVLKLDNDPNNERAVGIELLDSELNPINLKQNLTVDETPLNGESSVKLTFYARYHAVKDTQTYIVYGDTVASIAYTINYQ